MTDLGIVRRIACVNPRCKRTAPVQQEGEADIICQKCWKLLPTDIRDRYLQLRRRQKRIFKLIERRLVRGDISRATIGQIERQFTGRAEQNWRAIRTYFTAGEKPVGLEGFLQEAGL